MVVLRIGVAAGTADVADFVVQEGCLGDVGGGGDVGAEERASVYSVFFRV